MHPTNKTSKAAALKAQAAALRAQADVLEVLADDIDTGEPQRDSGDDRPLRVQEYAVAVDASVASVQRWIKSGMPVLRVGDSPRVRMAEANAWHEAQAKAKEDAKALARKAADTILSEVKRLSRDTLKGEPPHATSKTKSPTNEGKAS